jgi:hypothetical protein
MKARKMWNIWGILGHCPDARSVGHRHEALRIKQPNHPFNRISDIRFGALKSAVAIT